MSTQSDGAPAAEQRVAVVTGAARGIGAATVAGLARAGWSVVAVDRCADDPRIPYALGTRAELDDVVERARLLRGDAPGGVTAHVADTTDAAGLATAVDEAETRFGGLDAMIAVAGVIAGGVPLWEMPADQLSAVLDIDLLGPIMAARAAVPALLRRPPPRQGRYLAVASAAALSGLPKLAAYGAAKAGVAGLVRGLAAELAGSGITANAVCPGSTDTAMLAESARLYDLGGTGPFADQQPVGRLLSPAEVAEALVWLAGADRGAVTGVVLPVDGGLTL